MTDAPSFPQDGGCRCGQVRFRVSAPPILTMACHCKGCQRMTASAYSLSAAFPAEAFEVIQGEPVIGGLHGEARHYCCGHCMSWLYTKADGLDWFVNVRPTMLDAPAWFTPFVETCTDEKLPWASTPAPHGFGGIPDFEVFGELTQAYAKL